MIVQWQHLVYRLHARMLGPHRSTHSVAKDGDDRASAISVHHSGVCGRFGVSLGALGIDGDHALWLVTCDGDGCPLLVGDATEDDLTYEIEAHSWPEATRHCAESI